ncbi:MAG: hypothetical protein SVU88_03335, partial [Candidatus Nanohaloarchaea archaeon]|nr:hypothetical protein [Candidatus Nanohaloarchaea archaeon]
RTAYRARENPERYLETTEARSTGVASARTYLAVERNGDEYTVEEELRPLLSEQEERTAERLAERGQGRDTIEAMIEEAENLADNLTAGTRSVDPLAYIRAAVDQYSEGQLDETGFYDAVDQAPGHEADVLSTDDPERWESAYTDLIGTVYHTVRQIGAEQLAAGGHR